MLRDHTGGNPFFLQEYWHDLESRGGLDAVRSGNAKAPGSVQDALARRLAAFDATHTRVIELAAVAGDAVDPALLVQASDLDSDAVLEGIDLAVRAGLLVAGGDADGYRFAHSLARQAVLDRMAAADLTAAHARVAEVLESHVGEDDPGLVAQLAHHYVEARALGHADKAVHYLVLAAQQAVRGIAHSEAAALYERAAQLHVAQGPPRVELLSAAARCHVHAGHFPTARQIYEDLGADENPRVRLLAAIGHEDASWRPSENGQRSLTMLSEALRAAALEPDDPLHIRALASMGRAASFTGDRRRARSLGEDALQRARASGDEELVAHALVATLWQGLTPRLAPQLLARALELHEIGSRLGDDDRLGPAAFHRGAFAYIVGDEPAWSGAQRDLTEMALSRGQPFFRYVAGCSRYTHRYAVGDFAGAEHIVAWLDDQFSQEFGGATEGSWGVQQFMLRRVTGGLEQVRPLITGDESLDDHWLPGLLALYTDLDMLEPAARLLTAPVRATRRLSRRRPVGRCAGVHDRGCCEAGRPPSPRRCSGRSSPTTKVTTSWPVPTLPSSAPPTATSPSSTPCSGLPPPTSTSSVPSRWTGGWARSPTRWRPSPRGAGTGPAAAARRRTSARPRRPASPTRRARWPGASVTAGCSGTSTTDPAPRAEHAALPNGLTEREVDVLRLVADGLSNREIGERLFISANTAANHVRSILIKTAAPNRTKAAVFATEHGLLRS